MLVATNNMCFKLEMRTTNQDEVKCGTRQVGGRETCSRSVIDYGEAVVCVQHCIILMARRVLLDQTTSFIIWRQLIDTCDIIVGQTASTSTSVTPGHPCRICKSTFCSSALSSTGAWQPRQLPQACSSCCRIFRNGCVHLAVAPAASKVFGTSFNLQAMQYSLNRKTGEMSGWRYVCCKDYLLVYGVQRVRLHLCSALGFI